MKKKYKFLEHTADVKIRAEGKNMKEAFVSSAMALKEVISQNTKIKSKLMRKIEVKSTDFEGLLYNFLEEFIFLIDARDFVLNTIKNIKIKSDKNSKELKISAEVLGDRASNYRFSNDVKAVTYNQMKIIENNKQTVIEFVIDV